MQPRAKPQLLLPSLMVCLLIAPSLRGDEATDPKSPLPAKPQSLITISKETTYLTGPLTKDGYVDYVEALNQRTSQGVTPKNNAAVPFWKALGPKPIDEPIRRRFFKKLGISYPSEEGEYFVSIEDFAMKALDAKDDGGDTQNADPADAADEQQDRAMDGPWKADRYPVVADWLKANEKPLRLIVEGTSRPRYYCPLVGEGEPGMVMAVFMPGMSEYREVARALRARAMLELGSGDVDAAWQDLLACHRLARLIGQGPTLIDALLSIAIDGVACQADRLLVYHVRPNAKQAAAMCAALQKLPPLPKMAEKVDLGERFMGLDAIAYIAREGITSLENLAGGRNRVSLPEAIFNSLAKRMIDWDAILRMMNRWYDRFVAAMSKPDHAERQAAMDRLDEKLEKAVAEAKNQSRLAAAILMRKSVRETASQQIGNTLLALLMPALQLVIDAEGRGAMTADLTAVSLALAGYHAEHGGYPDDLAALAPQLIPEVPKDLFTGAPLHYRREGKGYILYSVGPNQKDDDGHTREDAQRQQPPDAVVNIIEGPVWDDITVRVPPQIDD